MFAERRILVILSAFRFQNKLEQQQIDYYRRQSYDEIHSIMKTKYSIHYTECPRKDFSNKLYLTKQIGKK